MGAMKLRALLCRVIGHAPLTWEVHRALYPTLTLSVGSSPCLRCGKSVPMRVRYLGGE